MPLTRMQVQQVAERYPQIGILPRSFLFGSDFESFAAELKGHLEVIRWTWYSFRVYPAAGSTQLLFFQQNMSTATNGIADTNMAVPGQLSGGEAMVIRNVRVVPIPAQADVFAVNAAFGLAAQQWYNVLTNNCWLELSVGDKLYIRGAPLTLFPAGQGFGSLFTSSQIAANVMNIGHLNNGDPSNRALWEEDPPIYVPSTRTVLVTINWLALNAVATAGRLGVMLDGWRIRLVQ